MSETRSYRAYFLNSSDHIRAVTVIQAEEDASAAAEAEFLLIHSEYAAIEIWDGKRLVVRAEQPPEAVQRRAG
ncbi:MAG TPA: hypothetical protein VFE34_08375 [Dongiaceae bacterium]|jgi:hypothetical protein|nr:hypothetical protein [Dongiaceae bacterium]